MLSRRRNALCDAFLLHFSDPKRRQCVTNATPFWPKATPESSRWSKTPTLQAVSEAHLCTEVTHCVHSPGGGTRSAKKSIRDLSARLTLALATCSRARKLGPRFDPPPLRHLPKPSLPKNLSGVPPRSCRRSSSLETQAPHAPLPIASTCRGPMPCHGGGIHRALKRGRAGPFHHPRPCQAKVNEAFTRSIDKIPKTRYTPPCSAKSAALRTLPPNELVDCRRSAGRATKRTREVVLNQRFRGSSLREARQ